ncbi:MAG: nuclear transport factor 2 family protein [Algoriphagus sp.]|uniref:nuclear transport factor 2 family protein n=1 Tax=Algoriphagus sp. TaxID=1872435 RepID=UPI00260E0549|nr:nuclear transport factor 2 family protein [Algoriphagus sp.]MDG1276038.1 nuclear transport factor 2 family protein [Algoriphagus sp.]
MKSLSCLISIFIIMSFSAKAQQSCMTEENIKALDAKWEEANLNPDPEFMESLLAEKFIWVHNHYSSVDSKETVVESRKRQKANGDSNNYSRTQSDVKVAITGNTAIVTGFTYIDRPVDPTNYHFMRTYVEIGGKCLLVGNHTMAVPEEE